MRERVSAYGRDTLYVRIRARVYACVFYAYIFAAIDKILENNFYIWVGFSIVSFCRYLNGITYMACKHIRINANTRGRL